MFFIQERNPQLSPRKPEDETEGDPSEQPSKSTKDGHKEDAIVDLLDSEVSYNIKIHLYLLLGSKNVYLDLIDLFDSYERCLCFFRWNP